MLIILVTFLFILVTFILVTFFGTYALSPQTEKKA